MSIDVHAVVRSSKIKNLECILCGECVDTCPKNMIRNSFSSGTE